jgi:hypothetical protein
VRAASKIKIRKDPFYNAVSVDRVEHYLDSVINHLTARGTLKPTLAKFRYLGLKTAVRRLLNSGFSDAVDFQTCFETLRDFDDIQSWLESLQLEYEGRIPRGYSIEELKEGKLAEVKEDAKRLGMVILDKKEYVRLLENERKYFGLIRSAGGWPLSLC